jgi:ornithine cyclodeaminase/alanine dehydrogenase-like protein (mu-crystallin family)
VTLAASRSGEAGPPSPSFLEKPAPLTTPQGALSLMDAEGKPFGYLNAEELTAFRTALASSLLLVRRRKVKTVLVFGVGKQAYWHIRLSLMLFGTTIRHVQFVNRTFGERSKECMKTFVQFDPAAKEKEGWTATTFGILTPGYGEYERLLKDQIRQADVIYTTTPSTEPLFDHTYLTNTEGRKKGRLIVAIGSYKKTMIELPHELVHQAVKRHGSGHHFHKHAEEGGAIIVDTLACVSQTGELTQAHIHETQTVELGELVLLESLVSDDSSSAISDSPSRRGSMDVSIESLNLGDNTRSMSQVFREPPSLPHADSTASASTMSSTTSGRSPRSSVSLSRKGSMSNPFHKRSDSASTATASTPSSSIFHKRSGSMSSSTKKKPRKQTEKENEMCRWLRNGNVIYKSVGMGLMDLVVGSDLVTLARSNGVGVTVEDF